MLTHIEEWEASSDVLQENLELYLRVCIVQAVLPRAGMPEQVAWRDLRFQVPIPNLAHGFIHWFIWAASLSCFSFIRPINNRISQSSGSPVWAGRGWSWSTPTATSGEFNPFPSKDGALVSYLSALAVGSKWHPVILCCVCKRPCIPSGM